MLTLQPLLSRNISLKYGEDHLSPSILGEEKSEKSEDVLSLSVIVLNGFSPKILKSHKKEKEKKVWKRKAYSYSEPFLFHEEAF